MQTILINIDKKDILDNDTSGLINILNALRGSVDTKNIICRSDHKLSESIMLVTDAYDDDPQELYSIPEFVAYMRKLCDYPNLFYFLKPTTKKLILYCRAVRSLVRSGDELLVTLDANRLERAVKEIGRGLIANCEDIKESARCSKRLVEFTKNIVAEGKLHEVN